MNNRFIDPYKFIEKLQSRQKPPPEYQKRKDDIESETRLLELRCSLQNRGPNEEELRKIVQMKLDLDTFLGDWIENS